MGVKDRAIWPNCQLSGKNLLPLPCVCLRAFVGQGQRQGELAELALDALHRVAQPQAEAGYLLPLAAAGRQDALELVEDGGLRRSTLARFSVMP